LGLLLALVLLAACAPAGEPAPAAPPADQPAATVATVTPAGQVPAPAATEVIAGVTPTATPPAPLAAQVNGQHVFLADYERRVMQYQQALVGQGIDPNTEEGQNYLAEAQDQVLQGMIDGVLIEQAAASLGLALADADLESQIEADIAAGGGQAAFDEWLAATGQSREDYKQMLRQSLLSQRVMESVTSGVGPTAEQVHARHIVLDSPEAAQQIIDMLNQGADFATLAREHSLDLATRDNGGDLGWFPRGLVAPELESAAFALQPGQVSGPVLLSDGVHLLQVVEREAARPLSPEEQLDLKLVLFEEWLARQRAAAVIERFVGE
jgi:foldase protein PrsA